VCSSDLVHLHGTTGIAQIVCMPDAADLYMHSSDTITSDSNTDIA